MATMTALSTVTVGAGGAATIDFTSIPQTYTDLIVKISGRSALAAVGDNATTSFNNNTSNRTQRSLYTGDGSTVQSFTYTSFYIWVPGSNATASTFGNTELYIPNYTGSNNKSFSNDVTTENNGTAAELALSASLWSDTAAITSVKVTCNGGNFVQYTTATLYGVFRGPETLPSTPTIGTAIATSATTATVAFTPTSATNVDASYTALSTPGSITATGSSSPVTVSGLTSGTAYTFQVRANNPGGSSAYSSASNSVTPSTSYESIATVTVGSGGAASASFTSIPATYTHLQLRWIGRASQANTGLGVIMRINNNTGSNYARHSLRGNGSAASATGSASTTEISLGGVPGSSSPSGMFGAGIIDILDYTNTNKYKTIRSMQGTNQNTTADDSIFLLSGFMFANTNAVTQIDVVANSSGVGFVEYSQFALYGIKGA
jgi:hypothetical protein